MDGLQIIELMGFRLPRSRIRISTEFSAHPPAEAKKTRTGESALLIYVETALCTAQLY